ncbi:MAG: antibiotic biosynthesis monooxygenase [Candidatus Binatia bacterium]
MPAILIKAEVDADRRYELFQVLKGATAAEQMPVGCLDRRLYEEVQAPLRFLMIEHWSDEAAMDEYKSSTGFRALIGAIKVLGTLESLLTVKEETIVQRQ